MEKRWRDSSSTTSGEGSGRATPPAVPRDRRSRARRWPAARSCASSSPSSAMSGGECASANHAPPAPSTRGGWSARWKRSWRSKPAMRKVRRPRGRSGWNRASSVHPRVGGASCEAASGSSAAGAVVAGTVSVAVVGAVAGFCAGAAGAAFLLCRRLRQTLLRRQWQVHCRQSPGESPQPTLHLHGAASSRETRHAKAQCACDGEGARSRRAGRRSAMTVVRQFAPRMACAPSVVAPMGSVTPTASGNDT